MYDYLILGGGMGGLSIAALLAKAGQHVCVLEAYDRLGGFAHSFNVNEYAFCHQVQYIVGCGEGGAIVRFLQKIGLDASIQFNPLDKDRFDRIQLGQTRFDIPTGLENYERQLVARFPSEAVGIKTYFATARQVFEQSEIHDHTIAAWDLLLHPIRHRSILRYRNHTLRQFFDELKLSPPLRAILSGQIGNECSKTSELSLIVHLCMQASYCESASFPRKGMGHFVDEVARIIREFGGVLKTNCPVRQIQTDGNRVTCVLTNEGPLCARHVISDLDPQMTLDLMEPRQNVPRRYRQRLDYDYSPSAFSVYLGLKDLNLIDRGFTQTNIWHHSLNNVDDEVDSALNRNDFSEPFLFISIPSLLTDPGALCPKGSQTMYIGTAANYEYFNTLQNSDGNRYAELKTQIGEHFIDIVTKHYLPELRKHLDVCVIHTPVDMHSIVKNPHGNIFGANLTPRNYGLRKLTFDTPFPNLHFVGSTASYPGIMGVILGSMTLFDRLAGTACSSQ